MALLTKEDLRFEINAYLTNGANLYQVLCVDDTGKDKRVLVENCRTEYTVMLEKKDFDRFVLVIPSES